MRGELGNRCEKERVSEYDLASLPERGEKRIAYIQKYGEDLVAESPFNVSECPVSDTEIREAINALRKVPSPEIRTITEITAIRWWCASEKGWHKSTFNDQHWNLGELPLVRDHSGPVYFRMCFSAPVEKRVHLSFESLYDEGVIYVNGFRVCSHKGFEPFVLDITQHILKGEQNILAIKVNPERAGGPTGIAGMIKVIGCHPVSIADPFVWTGSINGKTAVIHVEATVKNTLDKVFKGRISIELSGAESKTGKTVSAESGDFVVPACESERVKFSFEMKDPSLWTPEAPHLYSAHIKLQDRASAACVDDDVFFTGVRTVGQSAKSILINGEPTLIKGVSTMFYPEGDSTSTYTLTCPSDRWIVKNILLARKCGANIIRLHSIGGPPGEVMPNGYRPVANFSCATGYSRLARIADQMGIFLVWTDRNWLYFGNDVLYKYTPRKLARLLPPCMRYVRNSPSIIMWEGANEISLTVSVALRNARHLLKEGIPTDTSAEKKIARKMKVFFRQYLHLAKSEDPSRLIIPESFMMTLNAKPIVPMEPEFYKEPQLLLDTHDYTGWYNPIEPLQELATVWKNADAPVMLSECGAEAMPEWDLFRDCQSYLVWRNNLGRFSSGLTEKQLGRPLTKDEWFISQAWQAYVTEKMYELVINTGCAGIIQCTFSDGNATGYHKGVLDGKMRAKLGYLACARAWRKK